MSSLASQVASGADSKKSFAMAGLSKNCASCDDQVFGGEARRRDGETGFATEALLSSDRSWSRSETTVRGMVVAVEGCL